MSPGLWHRRHPSSACLPSSRYPVLEWSNFPGVGSHRMRLKSSPLCSEWHLMHSTDLAFLLTNMACRPRPATILAVRSLWHSMQRNWRSPAPTRWQDVHWVVPLSDRCALEIGPGEICGCAGTANASIDTITTAVEASGLASNPIASVTQSPFCEGRANGGFLQ